MSYVTLPVFDSLAQGLGYAEVPSPTSDEAHVEGAESSQIPDLPQGTPSPLTPVSMASFSEDAPKNAQTWNSGDKGNDWMGGPSY